MSIVVLYLSMLPFSCIVTEKLTEEPAPLLPVANFDTGSAEGSPLYQSSFSTFLRMLPKESGISIAMKKTDSTDQSAVCEYTAPGAYTARLTATNEKGADSKTTTITVLENNENGSENG
jgi:PKD repeat protein